MSHNKTSVDELIQTIKDVHNATEQFAVDHIFNNLSSQQLEDKEFMSKLFCSNNGNYEEIFECYCDFAFFGSRCETPGMVYWGEGWTAFQVLFSMFYIILAIMTWRFLRSSWNNEYGSFCKKIMRLCVTPKYLVILNLIIICTSKENKT